MRRITCLALLGLSLMTCPVQAEDIYLRNKLFKGPVQGIGRETQIGLKAFAEVMGLNITEQGGAFILHPPQVKDTDFGITNDPGGVYVVGRRVTSSAAADGTQMISLYEAAEAAGFLVRPNKQLHTIDVNVKPIPKIPVMAVNDPAPMAAEPASSGSSGPHATHKGVIPGQSADPTFKVLKPLPPKLINKPGQAVDIRQCLVPGRNNLVVFGASW